MAKVLVLAGALVTALSLGACDDSGSERQQQPSQELQQQPTPSQEQQPSQDY